LRMTEPCCANCVKGKEEKQEKLKSAEDFFKGLEQGLSK